MKLELLAADYNHTPLSVFGRKRKRKGKMGLLRSNNYRYFLLKIEGGLDYASLTTANKKINLDTTLNFFSLSKFTSFCLLLKFGHLNDKIVLRIPKNE